MCRDDSVGACQMLSPLLLLAVLLLPSIALIAYSLYCLVRWNGLWRIGPAITLTAILIIASLCFWPTPDNIWPISLFCYGIGFGFPLFVLSIVRLATRRARVGPV